LVYTDSNRLKQLFVNILDNAFNFTPAGGKITFVSEAKNRNVIFSITDTGSGISPEDLPHIKEKFYKGKTSKSKNGIGLSVCDEIVQLMGGTLDIESKPSSGTTVTVTIPSGEVV
jgi:signal transduction histidine kinase